MQRTQSLAGLERYQEYVVNLVHAQISFGLTYLEEARSADVESRAELADAAREIAINSYRSAMRFAARLARGADAPVRDQLEHFREQIDAVWPDLMHSSREIA
jgi:hypothetical protein